MTVRCCTEKHNHTLYKCIAPPGWRAGPPERCRRPCAKQGCDDVCYLPPGHDGPCSCPGPNEVLRAAVEAEDAPRQQPGACPFWADGEHCFIYVPSTRETPIKSCECGARVEAARP